MDVVLELKRIRAQAISQIDEAFSDLIARLEKEEGMNSTNHGNIEEKPFENIFPLISGAGFFKGKKPSAVIFPDGKRVSVMTWKKAVEEIMQDCCSKKENLSLLMKLRGIASGKRRNFLYSDGSGMRSPIKIRENLYMESHYDTESLLRIMTTRILDVVGYDYSGIQIAVKAERQI